MDKVLKEIEELGKYLGDIKGILEYEKTGITRINLDNVVDSVLMKLQSLYNLTSEMTVEQNDTEE